MTIHKCRRCVWSDKISSNLLYCMLPRCIVKEEKPVTRLKLNGGGKVPSDRCRETTNTNAKS